ncbi:hypothetical protein [Helicobacter trogontum]|uniref:Uncharacterized protein n=1 Tax=Helicobacter trogontum TaxID=50960 RepID=A0A4U8SAN4_9HELI|nr:hypothetical protein [Helicobacter trogontum]TLD82991.1 hypothetical protein LS81_006515 [Helicobacter trogontum]
MSEIHRNTESHNNAVSNNTANNNNTESKKVESITQENRKLDSNGEEIVWELETRKNVFFLLWSWIAKLGAMAFCIYFIFTYLHLVKWSGFVILLALLSVILYVVITSYTTLNLKGMYATKNNFYIEKYFGESISLPLGNFYITLKLGDYSFQTLAFITRLSIILFINNKRKYYCELSIVKDNFNILEKNLKQQTESYLMSLDEKDYATIFIPNIKNDMDKGYTAKIDFDKIDFLRKRNKSD